MAAKFTSDEILVIRRMAMQGECAVEIARFLKRDATSIRGKCKSINVELHKQDHRFAPEEVDAIRVLSKQGWSANAVAKQLGRTPLAIRTKACAIGVNFRLPRGDDLLTLKIDAQTKHYLQRAAEARGVHINQLMRQVLFQIVARDLVNALTTGTFKPPKAEVRVTAKPIEAVPPAPMHDIKIILFEPPQLCASVDMQPLAGNLNLNLPTDQERALQG